MRLRMALAQWKAAAAGAPMPTRNAIDPAKFGDLEGWMIILRVERDPMRFRYLMVGEKVVRRSGGLNLSGRYVEEHPHADLRDAINGVMTAVTTTARPHRAESRRRFLDYDLNTESVAMPLAGPDGDVDHILGLQIYETDTGERRP